MQIPRMAMIAGTALLLANPAMAKVRNKPIQVTETIAFSYADLADMALAAPIAAGAQIRRATRLKGAAAAGVPAGHVRFLVQADVKTLVRGAQGLPARVSYLVNIPVDGKNRPPKLRKARILLLANRVAGRPNEIRLIAPDAQLPWTADNEARIRAILVAAAAPDAPPAITGVAKAFHVPGSLPGESETQIFLTTADGSPISLAILRRPGETTRWAVSLAEMVDDSAAPPSRDTLLWYRLACFLPPALPDASTVDLDPEDAAAAAEDYKIVLAGLGRCERTIPR